MPELFVNDEQARMIDEATAVVVVRGQDGRLLGRVVPTFTAEEVEAMRADLASDQPRYTTQEVLEYLRKLESE